MNIKYGTDINFRNLMGKINLAKFFNYFLCARGSGERCNSKRKRGCWAHGVWVTYAQSKIQTFGK